MFRNSNPSTDNEPSIGHLYNAKVISKLLKPKASLLDIGCWSGQLYRAFSKPPFHFVGIDTKEAAQALEIAKVLSPNATWQVGSALKLSFKNNSFDMVTMLDVIEHLPVDTEQTALREIFRVLKPGGLLVLSTPAHNLLSILSDPAYFILGHRHYTSSKLNLLFTTSGFVNKSFHTTGGWWYVGYYWLHLIRKHLFNFPGPTLKKVAANQLGKSGFLTHYFVLSKL